MVASRLRTIERRYDPSARYYRYWDPHTIAPHRKLKCYIWDQISYMREIFEDEFLAATGARYTNAELELIAGQTPEVQGCEPE